MKAKCLAAAALLGVPLWAAQPYYLTDALTSLDPLKWVEVGTLSPGSAGLTAPDAAGGSLISRIPIPDGSGEAEVRMTLRLAASGGTYTEFLQATPDARTGGPGGGTYLAFEMQNPQIDSQGHCDASFVVLQSIAGVTSLLSAFQHACRDGMVMRLAVHGAVALLWPDQDTPMELEVSTPGVGQPGIGSHGAPAGNGISEVRLGAIDRIAPPAIDKQKVGVSAFRNRVDVQWTAVTDDSSGSGLAEYWITRDGFYFMRATSPMFQDFAVSPSETHTYTIATVDQHYNFSPPVSFTVSTPVPQNAPFPNLPNIPKLPAFPANVRERRPSSQLQHVTLGSPGADSGNGMDPRRIGVRPLGAYWGAAGEQIDTTSGNLNFSIPLLKVLSRGGWSVTFALSYNSQMWRQDSAGTWLLGYDVGYGLGWMLQAGSLIPVWTNTSQVDHWLYVDATGAEYSLSTNTNNVWTTREGIYISFDWNTGRLYFPDGSFWVMGSQSSAGEPDSGAVYPTLIQDSNGNQITIAYDVGAGVGAANTSSRITLITDPRTAVQYGGGLSPTYTFTYNSGHLRQINGPASTPEQYLFSYASQPLNSPFSPSIAYGSITFLQTMTLNGLGVSHNFQYDSTGTGEMTQMTTPLGGNLQWQYRTFTYGSGITLREVQARQMTSSPGTSNSWTFTYDDTYSPTFHFSTTIRDLGTGTHKMYYVSTQILYSATTTTLLPYVYGEFNANGSEPFEIVYQWLEENGNVHKYVDATYFDYGTTSSATKMTYQYRDAYGNITQFHVFDYGHSTNPADWVYNLTYLTDPNYLSRYVRNRLAQATVTRNGVNTVLRSNSYDVYNPTPLTDRPNLVLHDSSYNTSFTYRGNVTSSGPDNHTAYYDIGGVVTTSVDGAGRSVSSSPNSSTNYSLPAVLNNGNVSSTISYAGSWAVTSVIDSNGPSSNTTYDSFGRPTSTTSADGAVTNYTYTYNPNTQTATITHPPENPTGNTWKRTTLDGFGRTTKVETGHDSTTVSQVDTQYAPCACSPLGKLYRTSQPYATGGTPVWNTNTYDGSGRTLTVTAPDNSVSRYSYQGNQITVTDPTGKWKTSVTDAQGNLTQVIEPNPAGGANFVATYTYDGVNHLTSVTMTRPEGTQTRTFQYTGPDLTSTTNPENGTVTYTYNSAHQVLTRIDAKNQKTQYTYDTYGRLSEVQHFYSGIPCTCEDTGEQWHYYYDTPIDPSYPATYTSGRLAAVTFGADLFGAGFTYEYGYSPAGRTTMQRMQVTGLNNNNAVMDLDATYTWDNEGRMTARTYPSLQSNTGPSLAYQYDIMGRLNGLTQNGTSQVTAAYGPASELTSLSYFGYSESRTYNSLLQLTRQTVPGVFDTEYVFPTGQNNGQISSSIDHISGEQVNYTYDALKRLTAAGTVGPQWGQAYTYDGFGNLTAATVTQGSGVNWANASNASNQMIGISYDANGNNITAGAPCCATIYNVENRVVSQYLDQNVPTWMYDPWGKRVAQVNGSPGYTWTLYFFDIFGKQIETLTGDSNFPNTSTTLATNVYFGGRLVKSNGVTVVTDRLGSVRANSSGERFSFLPYGYERTASTNARVKFGTYLQDASDQDYADQRYYNPWYGRFNTPDPSGLKAVDPRNPITWNRYAYVNGDPVNLNDGTGLINCNPDEESCDNLEDMVLDDAGSLFIPGPAIFDIPFVSSMFSPITEPEPVKEDVAIDPRGQTVISGVNQMNPGGFINAASGVLATGYLGGVGAGLAAGFITAGQVAVAGTAAGVAGSPQGQEAIDGAVDVGTQVFRVFGGTSPGLGNYWTTVDPTTVTNYANAAGLPAGNTGQFLAIGNIVNMTDVMSGTAAQIGANLGGLPEVIIPNPASQIVFTWVGGLNPGLVP